MKGQRLLGTLSPSEKKQGEFPGRVSCLLQPMIDSLRFQPAIPSRWRIKHRGRNAKRKQGPKELKRGERSGLAGFPGLQSFDLAKPLSAFPPIFDASPVSVSSFRFFSLHRLMVKE
jgi:hypothetical protein